jgi:hypothetical protein
MLDIFSRVSWFLGRVRVPAARKRRGQMYFQPALEILESRTLLSFEVSATLRGAAYAGPASSFPGFQSTTANPVNVSATFQGLGASLSTQGNASSQATATSWSMNANIQSTEQHDQTYDYNGVIFAQTENSFAAGVTLSDTSIVTFSGNFQASPPLYTVLDLRNISGGAAVSILGSLLNLNPDGQTQTVQVTLPAGSFGFFMQLDSYARITNLTPTGIGPVTESGPTSCSFHFEMDVSPPTMTTATVVTPTPNPSTYGQPVTFTATVTPTAPGSGTPTGTVTLMDGATALGTGTLGASGTASFTTSALSARTHSITAVYAGSGSFTGSTSSPVTQTVNPAPLDIYATTDTKVYDGTTSSSATPAVVGTLYNGDMVTGLRQAFVSKNVLGPNGSTLQVTGYTINDGNGGGNYIVTPHTATGTISQAPLDISATTDTKVYDGTTSSDKSPTFQVANEPANILDNGDTLTGLSQAFDSKNAGTRTLSINPRYTINDGNGGGNYTVTPHPAAGTISQAPLYISATTDTKVYDGTIISNKVPTVVGTLYNGDTVTGLSQVFDSADVLGSNRSTLEVTPYTIIDSNGGNVTGNYSVKPDTATGTITKKTVTVTANASRIYGVANPTFNASYNGFVPGDSIFTGSPVLTTTATATSPPGYYTITINLGTLAAQNYTFSPMNGTLTITQAPLYATGVNVAATAGAPFFGPVATFINADPFGSAASYTAIITWGDGSISFGGITGVGTLTVIGAHTYADPVNEVVGVNIIHNLGYTMPAVVIETATVANLGLGVEKGLAGGVGFWNNKKGQALINSFNGGSTSTALSGWLAVSFPNLYGVSAGSHNLAEKTNAQVAAFFQSLFSLPSPQADAQVLAAALSVYATASLLGGNAAAAYGFTVSATGLGARSYNVGNDGTAFGVANKTTLNVYELLVAVNRTAVKGGMYNGDSTLQAQAADLFNSLTQAGTIP